VLDLPVGEADGPASEPDGPAGDAAVAGAGCPVARPASGSLAIDPVEAVLPGVVVAETAPGSAAVADRLADSSCSVSRVDWATRGESVAAFGDESGRTGDGASKKAYKSSLSAFPAVSRSLSPG